MWSNKHFLRVLYLDGFMQAIEYFARALNTKVLPAFSDISEEASKVEQDTADRLSRASDPEWYDPASIAEPAFHAGVDFYIMATGIAQGITNMFAAGLYHLFEQQLLKFHRRELLMRYEEDDPALLTLSEAQKRLREHDEIDITTFASWGILQQLRLIANCVKHAEGPSCEQLKQTRPDLFVYPSSRKNEWDIAFAKAAPVFQPLAGEDFFLTLDEFNKYVDAVKQFWAEFGEAFDRSEYPRK